MISAKIIEDSLAPHGVRLTTFQLRYPRPIHAELLTHRVFSRNASSNRALPVAKVISQVMDEPWVPQHWGLNQPGMQAAGEASEMIRRSAIDVWLDAAYSAAVSAEKLRGLGLHKQIVNRLLEPFQFISVIVTSTEWDNFFELRDHGAAEPHMNDLAVAMKAAMRESKPVQRPYEDGTARAWHLPYVSLGERATYLWQPHFLARISAARCARVSYLNHDGSSPDPKKDIGLFEKLVGSRPRHASPVEHPACPLAKANLRSRNFRGWRQYRELIEG